MPAVTLQVMCEAMTTRGAMIEGSGHLLINYVYGAINAYDRKKINILTYKNHLVLCV